MRNIDNRFRTMRTPLIWGLAILLVMGPHSLPAAIWTGEIPDASGTASAETRKIVVEKLERVGLSPEEAQSRLEGMQEQEIATIAASGVGIRRGGDGVVTVLVIVLLVGLIFYVFNHAGHRM